MLRIEVGSQAYNSDLNVDFGLNDPTQLLTLVKFI